MTQTQTETTPVLQQPTKDVSPERIKYKSGKLTIHNTNHDENLFIIHREGTNKTTSLGTVLKTVLSMYPPDEIISGEEQINKILNNNNK